MYISYQYFKWWINCKWRRRQRKSAPNTVMHENLMFTLYNLCGKPSNDQTLQVIEQRGALILGYFLVCCLSVLIDLSLDCPHRNLTLIHAVVVGFSHVIRLKLHESFLRDSLLSYGQREEWLWLYFAWHHHITVAEEVLWSIKGLRINCDCEVKPWEVTLNGTSWVYPTTFTLLTKPRLLLLTTGSY